MSSFRFRPSRLVASMALFALALPLSAQNSIQAPPRPLVGQSSASSESTRPVGNLLLTLKVYNQDVQLNSMELLLANKPTQFTVELIDPRDKLGQIIKFTGILKQLQNGSYTLSYSLNKSLALEYNGNTQYRDVGWQAMVEISPDKPITLMKNSDTRYILTLSAAPEPSKSTDRS